MEMTFDGPSRGAQPAGGISGARLANGVRLNDRYEIEEFLGRTPYGESYRARDLASGQLVAIKALQPALIADASTMERLTREVAVAASLDHKNIATTFGLFGAQVGADPVAYLACEFVDGQTLREMLEKKRASGRAFSLKGAYNVVAHLCNALVYAHGATVHGALTPDSVMVNSAGRVKLTDFGLARTLKPLDNFRAQVAAGTMAALAPEMMSQPDQADARADLYSVGVILFELLTGRTPADSFERPSVAAPGVPAAVDPVVEMCLKPSPDERYADAQALKEALQTALAADLAGPNAQAAAAIAMPPGQRPTPQQAAPKQPMPIVNTPTPPPRPAMSSAPKQAPPPRPQAPVASAPPPQQTPPPSSKRPSLEQAAVPKSFNVDAALSAVDDTHERWLIQKDKLDFGPFAMKEVRSQIESGKIVGEHVIIDTENGQRQKVKDHPQLRQLVMEAEARIGEQERLDQEARDRSKFRGRMVTIFALVGLAVLGLGGGAFWYAKKHGAFETKVVKELVHDGEYDFMKGVEITMKMDPPPPKTKRPSSGHRVGKNGKNEFNDVTNLGDASGDGGDETLDGTVVQRVMSQNFKVLVGCMAEERRRNPSLHKVDMEFIVKGSGQVSAVKANGSTSSPMASCMYGKMQSVAFPKFNGNKTQFSYSLALK